MYILARWKKTDDGREPDLPPEASYLWLGDGDRDAQFGLFEYQSSSPEVAPPGAAPVPSELALLIECAKTYSPALALAREEVAMTGAGDHESFLAAYAVRLRHHLTRQGSVPFILAEARVEELGYKAVGGYYWIVGYDAGSPGREIAWVSHDYFVYRDPLDHFMVDSEALAARFNTLATP